MGALKDSTILTHFGLSLGEDANCKYSVVHTRWRLKACVRYYDQTDMIPSIHWRLKCRNVCFQFKQGFISSFSAIELGSASGEKNTIVTYLSHLKALSYRA